MSRIRYLKPDFFKDEDLAQLPFEARLFFQGLWVIADKEGRLEERPLRLKIEIFPYDKVDIDKCLDLLSRCKNGSKKPFIQRYEVEGEKFIQILKWQDHQRPHHTEKDSTFPEPPAVIKGMEKGMGMGNEHLADATLDNGVLTVKKDKPLKTKHLDFVLLAGGEFEALKAKFGELRTNEMIEKLNNYIGSTGKRYKSHYHTLLNWFSKEGDSAGNTMSHIPEGLRKFMKKDSK